MELMSTPSLGCHLQWPLKIATVVVSLPPLIKFGLSLDVPNGYLILTHDRGS